MLLATPTADRQICAELYSSVLKTVLAFGQHHPNVGFGFLITDGALVSTQRNVAATRMLVDEQFTHLLFVDSDMGFRPDLVAKMLAFDRPVVGCMYPLRRQDSNSTAASLRYVLESAPISETSDSKPRYRVHNGFVRTSALGTGIMMIKRSALQEMSAKFPALWTKENRLGDETYDWCNDGLFQCFAPFARPDGFYISEDAAFCHRWTEGCGGELWACVTEPVSHVGRTVFTGAFIDKIGPLTTS